MTTSERRINIKQELLSTDKPCSATSLSKKFGVSRQAIVGDIAVLRASGEDIFATPRGYLYNKKSQGNSYIIACNHTSAQLNDEIYIIVDNGGILEDVSVESPLYGEINGKLHITSRYDANIFIEKAKKEKQSLLSNLTNGVHLHKIICENIDIYNRIIKELDLKNILYKT